MVFLNAHVLQIIHQYQVGTPAGCNHSPVVEFHALSRVPRGGNDGALRAHAQANGLAHQVVQVSAVVQLIRHDIVGDNAEMIPHLIFST